MTQAIDRVWLGGFLHKFWKAQPYSLSIESYFVVIYFHFHIIYGIESGVPQSNILQPLLLHSHFIDEWWKSGSNIYRWHCHIRITQWKSIVSQTLYGIVSTKENKRCIRASKTKKSQITFTNRRRRLPYSMLINQLSRWEDVKYRGMHTDRWLTWTKHFTKHFPSRNSKRLVYKVKFKPNWLTLNFMSQPYTNRRPEPYTLWYWWILGYILCIATVDHKVILFML